MLKEGSVLDGQLTSSQMERCQKVHVVLATRENDLLIDLLSGMAYRLATYEYPGSADDAATYGEWRLDEAQSAKRPPAKPAPEPVTGDHS